MDKWSRPSRSSWITCKANSMPKRIWSTNCRMNLTLLRWYCSKNSQRRWDMKQRSTACALMKDSWVYLSTKLSLNSERPRRGLTTWPENSRRLRPNSWTLKSNITRWRLTGTRRRRNCTRVGGSSKSLHSVWLRIRRKSSKRCSYSVKCSTSQSLPDNRWANIRGAQLTQSSNMRGSLTPQSVWSDQARSTWRQATYRDNKETDKEIIHSLRITSMKSLARYLIQLGDRKSLSKLQLLSISRWCIQSCRLIWLLLQYLRCKAFTIGRLQMSFQG